MSDNILDNVYVDDSSVYDQPHDGSQPAGDIFTYIDGMGGVVQFGVTPKDHAVWVHTDEGEDVLLPIRGAVKDLIQALTAEYERVTGESI